VACRCEGRGRAAAANGDDHAPVWIVRNKVDLVGGENAGAVTAQFDISAAHEEAFLT
jgi:tRNA modification GTPase